MLLSTAITVRYFSVFLNEPHDIKPVGVEKPTTVEKWDVWYNGGQIIVGGEEVTAIGHQQLLNEIRKQGANNICIPAV